MVRLVIPMRFPLFVLPMTSNSKFILLPKPRAATLIPHSLTLPKTYWRPKMKRPHELPVASHQVFLKKILLMHNIQRLS
ncbi:hypothetical protein RRG08_022736 [Elysia crispata]|uniref:Uncharacterized protein n=1 Tax=Elysia crispata TaxID=231223 RepID=A0AAE1DEN8_9GAST|nr:hypothetical protein RRG08_022736 [Elysia crispata]